MKIRNLLAALTVTLVLTGGAVGAFQAAPQQALIADSDNVLTPDVG